MDANFSLLRPLHRNTSDGDASSANKDRNNRYSYLLSKEILEIVEHRIITGINIALSELKGDGLL